MIVRPMEKIKKNLLNPWCFITFFLEPQEGVCITLDCAQAQFLSYDRAVISLKGGELYVLSLLVRTCDDF